MPGTDPLGSDTVSSALSSEPGPVDAVEITETNAGMEGVEPTVYGDSTANEIPQVEITGIASTVQGGAGDAMEDVESPAQLQPEEHLESAPLLDGDTAAHSSTAEVGTPVGNQEQEPQQSIPPTTSEGDPLVEGSASELATPAAGVSIAAPSEPGASETKVSTGDKEKIRLAKVHCFSGIAV